MRVIVVRHFRTVNNETKRIMGWGDAPRASDWEEDLIAVDRVFNDQGLRFDAVYSSALGRARQTALYLADRQGAGPVTSRTELNEVNYGDLFGMTKRRAVAQHPLYKEDPAYVFPGGESFQLMQTRSVAIVRSLETLHADDTLLLVAHAGVIRGLICHFLGLAFAPHLKRKISHRYIGDAVVVPVMLGVLKPEELRQRLSGRLREAPGRGTKSQLANFDRVWKLQAFLLSEADRTGTPILINDDKDKVTDLILSNVVDVLAGSEHRKAA